MNKLEEIIELLSDTDQSLIKSLFRFKVIAYELDDEEIKNWVNNEINGYSDDDNLPDYRIVCATIRASLAGPFGSSMNNITLGTHHLSKDEEDRISRPRLRNGIQFFEKLDKSSFSIPVPPIYYSRLAEGFESPMNIYAASVIPTASAVDDILCAVRSRLLDFLLLANKKLKIDNIKDIQPIQKKEVIVMFRDVVFQSGSVVNVVTNSPHAATSVDGNSITIMYDKELADAGVTEEDINEMKNLLETNKESVKQKDISFLDGWIEKVSSYSGSLSKSVIIDILAKLILAKFGIVIG